MNTPSPQPAQDPAWSGSQLDAPHAQSDKPERVRKMFSAIAGSYDLNNRLHSFGRDQAWRRFAVRKAAVKPGDAVLDVACGTGDLTELFAATPASRVVGADFTAPMLDLARQKQTRLPKSSSAKVEYIEADAQNLPFPDQSFDVLSIAFGIRNVMDPARAIAQFARVLRPGGRLVVLEFDRPSNPLIRTFNSLYTTRIMPRTATLVSGDQSGAYRYLPASVNTFLTSTQLSDLISASGFQFMGSHGLTFGVCRCYLAIRTGDFGSHSPIKT
jgi:demethylmenaquinone methyltransferase/2-methoxy-6-polyprenyl-1,4-benzoquinol methylase